MARRAVHPLPEPEGEPDRHETHPPGALLFFVGLGSPVAAGLAVTAVAATMPLAVLMTARPSGRGRGTTGAAVPGTGPGSDLAVGLGRRGVRCRCRLGSAALAVAAVRRSSAWSVAAGLVLGYAVMMSYELLLLGILAVAFLLVARSWYPLPFALGAAVGVVLVFAALGVAGWEAFPALHDRYWAGIASRRPATYWLWDNLAALLFAAGPVLGAALASAARDKANAVRRPGQHAPRHTRCGRTGDGCGRRSHPAQQARGRTDLAPFVPSLMLSCAYLPGRWRKVGLAVQVAFAITVQHLLRTAW